MKEKDSRKEKRRAQNESKKRVRREKKNKREKPKKSTVKHPLESTQMNIPIKEILTTGTIVMKDGRYIRIVEIKAGTFLLRNRNEQRNIISQFAALMKVMPSHFQIIALTLPSDMSEQIEIVNNDIATETNPSARQMSIDYKKTLQEEEKRGITRRFFIVIQYEGGWMKKRTIEDVEDWFNLQVVTIADALSACGNEIVKPDPNAMTGAFLNTSEIIYTMYNREKPGKQYFDQHLQDTANRYFYMNGNQDVYIPPIEYIAPKEIFYISPSYIRINNMYYSFFYIPSSKYKSEVFGGWVSNILMSINGVDMSIYFRKIDASSIKNKLRRNINWNGSTVINTSDTSDASSTARNAETAGRYIKYGIENNNEDFFYMNILISICGYSIEEVEKKIEIIQTNALKHDIQLESCEYEEEQAMNSMLPFNRIDENLYQKSRRNILTSSAAAVYPFTTFELCDSNGVFLGKNKFNDTLVSIDFFKRTNPNIFICGETGAGKTYTTLLIAIRMRSKKIPIYIIAPEKDHEFSRVCQAMGGQFITLAQSSANTINIMEIHKRDTTNSKLLDGNYQELSLLTEKVETVKVFIRLLIKDMSYEEQQLLDEALYRTYEKKGITKDNNSLWADKEHKTYKTMPILSDLRAEMKDNKRCERIYNILGIFTVGSGSSFNGQTNVNLNSDFTVISTQHLRGETMPLGIFLAMDFLWSKIKEDRTKKKALMIDEFWKMNDAADQMLEIAKTCRAYSCSFILATQQIRDIMKNDSGIYGEGILNNCATKIIMKMVKKDADNVQNIIGITEDEKDDLEKFNRGDALIINEEAHVEIHFHGSATEHMLITTSGDDLRKMIDEKKREKARKEKEEEFNKELKYVNGELVKTVEVQDEKVAIDLTADDFELVNKKDKGMLTSEELNEFLDLFESSYNEESKTKNDEDIDLSGFQLADSTKKRKIYTDDELIASFKPANASTEKENSKNSKEQIKH